MKSKLILIGVGASLLLTGIWFFVLWSPQGKNLEKAKAEQAAAEQRQSQLQVRLTHLQKLEANAEVLERDRALLATAIPSTDELDAFILQVNERAAKAGVTFVSVAPQQPAAGAPTPGAAPGAPTAIGLQMQVTGDYFAVLRFMEQLRDGPRLVTVDTFSLSKGGEGAEMSASIGGKMFLSPTVTAPAVAATPSA
ncbi:MAG: type 4a pilus biogenesis protein PilO [Actinobacteria bacterium]|nr:type 4a pilus biogenesis protein PilO [Actinomycetota bacterium]MBW3650046.1 type 4a pilus biogenesis protein PilO [Actinomycetota bacterium]